MKTINTKDVNTKYAISDENNLGSANSINGFKIWVGTEEEYNQIENISNDTIYFIMEEE